MYQDAQSKNFTLLESTYLNYNKKSNQKKISKDVNQLINYVKGALGKNNLDYINKQKKHSADASNLNNEFNQLETRQQIIVAPIDNNINGKLETLYVPLLDLSTSLPVSKLITNGDAPYGLPKDPLIQLYFAGIAGIGIYIIYRLMDKSN